MNKQQTKEYITLNRICYNSSKIVAIIRELKKYPHKISIGYKIYKDELELEKANYRAKLNQSRENTQLRWNARKEKRKLQQLYKEETTTIKRRRI